MGIIEDVKKKIEFSGIEDNLVKEKLDETLRQNPKLKEFLERERSEGYKKIIKLTREKLHRAYGAFQIEDKTKVMNLIGELEKEEDLHDIYAIHNMLLSSTVSTKERIPFYEEMYTKIFKITGWPKSIMDLGCGFNPMSFPFMKLEEARYFAYDINRDDMKILNRYFEAMGNDLDGEAAFLNLENVNFKSLPKSDVCFIFKVMDILDKKNHKKSEEIITSIDCKWIVVSFSTKTVSGKKMKHPYRGWMNKMLERLGYEFKILEFENEIFYVIKKK